MQKISDISAEQFMLHFYEDIRVPVEWKSLVANAARVDCFEIQDRDELGDLYTVWGKEKDGAYLQNHSLKVRDQFPVSCEIRLNNFSKTFSMTDAVLIAAPVYKCHCNKYVLLDRTHRSISFYRANSSSVRMIIYVIDAQLVPQSQNCNQCKSETS